MSTVPFRFATGSQYEQRVRERKAGKTVLKGLERYATRAKLCTGERVTEYLKQRLDGEVNRCEKEPAWDERKGCKRKGLGVCVCKGLCFVNKCAEVTLRSWRKRWKWNGKGLRRRKIRKRWRKMRGRERKAEGIGKREGVRDIWAEITQREQENGESGTKMTEKKENGKIEGKWEVKEGRKGNSNENRC